MVYVDEHGVQHLKSDEQAHSENNTIGGEGTGCIYWLITFVILVILVLLKFLPVSFLRPPGECGDRYYDYDYLCNPWGGRSDGYKV